MTDRKNNTTSITRERADPARTQNGQFGNGSKVAEMATLTAAASGLALGAVDTVRADDEILENNVFARVFRDDTEEQAQLVAEPAAAVGATVEEEALVLGSANPVSNTVPGEDIKIVEAATTTATAQDTAEAPFETSAADLAPQPLQSAEPPIDDAAIPTPGSSSIMTEKLAEGIASQISSGIDRIVDGISTGTLQPGFAQDLAGEIVSNVRTMLDDALPAAGDLGASIRADVAETLGSAGVEATALLSSSTATIDQLTGRVDDMLADANLISSAGAALDGQGSIADTLSSLPASILGGSDRTPGALGELFYDDGAAPAQPVAQFASSITDTAGTAVAHAINALAVDLGFIGQSDLGDAGSILGFSGNSNPLHLV